MSDFKLSDILASVESSANEHAITIARGIKHHVSGLVTEQLGEEVSYLCWEHQLAAKDIAGESAWMLARNLTVECGFSLGVRKFERLQSAGNSLVAYMGCLQDDTTKLLVLGKVHRQPFGCVDALFPAAFVYELEPNYGIWTPGKSYNQLWKP